MKITCGDKGKKNTTLVLRVRGESITQCEIRRIHHRRRVPERERDGPKTNNHSGYTCLWIPAGRCSLTRVSVASFIIQM